jgi:acyl carrier protein
MEQKIKKILVDKFGLMEGSIHLSTILKKDLKLDSLDMLEFISGLEYEFKIQILEEHIEKVKTLEELVSIIKKLSGTTNAYEFSK